MHVNIVVHEASQLAMIGVVFGCFLLSRSRTLFRRAGIAS